MSDKNYSTNLPLGTAMPTDSVNNTITIVIVLKYNGGMYVALAIYMLCLYSHTLPLSFAQPNTTVSTKTV